MQQDTTRQHGRPAVNAARGSLVREQQQLQPLAPKPACMQGRCQLTSQQYRGAGKQSGSAIAGTQAG